ncbi:hypothetical protein [Halomonas sp. BC04]|uniref:hypothetical protein n=1 Tax=Halomonas sp. BC04 TaxID=1403540 RepID=UPI0003ED7B35|nr:hypothetical protein [Halomonas sp. BC04]EWG98253.1 hypothetical protein Q427_31700 [Halomonas sp. BC04]
MELMSTGWHAFSAFLVLITGLSLSLLLPRYFKLTRKFGVLLYAWHTLWCMVYLWYVLNDGGDALMYYRASFLGGVSFLNVGTHSVIALTSIFTGYFGLSLIGVFLVFNIFGYVGLLAFSGALNAVTANKRHRLRLLALLILLLPSVSFWSSAIGKDAISFMATGLALWAAINLRKRACLMAFAVLAMFFVRPHMAGIMIISLSVAFALHAKVPVISRILLGTISVGVGLSLVPFALQYTGVGEATDLDALMSYVERRQGHNLQGGSSVNISSMSLPMQLFTYMFRPLIFEARSIFQLAAAIDNIILMYLFLIGGLSIWKGRKSPVQDTRIFLWLYAFAAWAVLAMTTANLGIAMRQKWMFAPMLVYLLISVMGSQRQVALDQKKCSKLQDSRKVPKVFSLVDPEFKQ